MHIRIAIPDMMRICVKYALSPHESTKAPKVSARAFYRQMALKLRVGKVDDHLRIHGFVMAGRLGSQMLSPAFAILLHLNAATLPQSIGVGSFADAADQVSISTHLFQ